MNLQPAMLKERGGAGYKRALGETCRWGVKMDLNHPPAAGRPQSVEIALYMWILFIHDGNVSAALWQRCLLSLLVSASPHLVSLLRGPCTPRV